MDMSDDDVVVAGRRMMAQGRKLDTVLAAVKHSSPSRVEQLARLRAITGLGLVDAQDILFSDSDLAHLGQQDIGLIHSFPRLTGEYASKIRMLYVGAIVRNKPWLTAIPYHAAPHINHSESDVYYWEREEPGPVDGLGFGFFAGPGFDAFRAQMRAIPDDPPRHAVVIDDPRLFTCRFVLPSL